MAIVILSAMVKAYSAKNETIRKTWMTPLVSHKAAAGALFSFSCARKEGIVRFCGAEHTTSAARSDHDRELPRTEIRRPTLMNTLPHGPTMASMTPAIEGDDNAARHGPSITPL